MTAMKADGGKFRMAGSLNYSAAVRCDLIRAEDLSWWENPSINEPSGRERQFLLNFLLFHDSGLLLIYMDADGKILFGDKALEDITGYDSSELSGKRMRDIFMPFESAEHLDALSQRPAEGVFPLEYENFILTRGGSRKYTVWRGGRFLADGGGGERMVLAGFDMRDREKQESRLHEKMKHKTGSTEDVSPITKEGKKPQTVVSAIESALASLADELKSGKAGQMTDDEFRFERPELIALKEQVRMITSVFENANEGIIITDASGAIRCVNPALCVTTGYSVGDFVGKNPSILKSGKHDASFYATMWGELNQTGKWQGKVWNKRKNGEIYPTWLSISAIKDQWGHPVQYIGISVDMSRGRKNADGNEASYSTNDSK